MCWQIPGGEWKLHARAGSGNGEKAVEKQDSQSMVASLDSSTKAGRKSTGKTNALTQEQSLEILAQAILNCQQSGVSAGISQLFSHGHTSTLIVLANIELVDGKLVKVGNGGEA
jgi:hypothetical protein